jgi:hypothetical protein
MLFLGAEDFFGGGDFLLGAAANFFEAAFGRQAGTVDRSSCFFFDAALQVVKRSLRFVSDASLHGLSLRTETCCRSDFFK